MSLKKSFKRLIAVFMIIVILSSNFNLFGLGISKVVAEELEKINLNANITNSKYIQYATAYAKGASIQSNLQIGIDQEQQGQYMLIHDMEILINLPVMNGYFPKRANVVKSNTLLSTGELNNNKINQHYDIASGLLSISYENEDKYESYIQDSKDEFEIIYIYPEDAYRWEEQEVYLEYTINAKANLYTETEIQTIKINKIVNLTEKENRGDILDLDIEQKSKETYKGFMYSNVENDTTYETEYITTSSVNILNCEGNRPVVISFGENNLVKKDNDSEEILSTDAIEYISTTINKLDFDKIIGQEGYIEIYNQDKFIAQIRYIGIDLDGNKKLAVIDDNGKVNLVKENDNILINYLSSTKNINIKMSQPKAEGYINFENKSKIMALNDYGCEVDKISGIQVKEKINDLERTIDIELLEPETKISLELSNINFSTLQENQTTLTVKLDDTNSYAKLFNNPILNIKMPEGLTNVDVSNLTILNGNGLKIKENAQVNENVITINLEGTQKEYDLNNVSGGTSIVIELEDIEFNNTLPTHEDKIELTCEQGEEKVTFSKDVNIVSKEGTLIISNFNLQNKDLNITATVDNTLSDMFKSIEVLENTEKIKVKQDIAIINNNQDEIEDVEIIGYLKVNIDESKKSTFNINLEEAINLNNIDATIEYLLGDEWINEYNKNATAYKIKLNDSIESRNTLKIGLVLNIPEKLGYNQQNYIKTQISYKENGIVKNNEMSFGVYTKVKDDTEIKDDIEISVVQKYGPDFIEPNSEVKEGQILKYIIKVTNNTDEDKNNLKLKTTIQNAVYYELVEIDDLYNQAGDVGHRYKEAEVGDVLREIQISIPANTTKQYEYQIVVNKDVQDISNNIDILDSDEKVLANNNLQNKVEDANIKLKLEYSYNEENTVYSNATMNIALFVKNLTEKQLKDVSLKILLPEELECYSYEFFGDAVINMELDDQTNMVDCKISYIPADTEYKIILLNKTKDIDYNLYSKNVKIVATSTYEDKTYMSNELFKDIYQSRSDLKMNLKNDLSKQTVSDNDIINYTLNITNKGILEYKSASIYTKFANGVNLIKAEIIYKDGTKENLNIINNKVDEYIKILKEDNIIVKYQVELDSDKFDINAETLENTFMVSNNSGINLTEKSILNIDEASQNKEESDRIPSTNPEEKPEENPEENPEEKPNENPEPNIPKEYSISGIVWIDENKDGKRDENEKLQENINVTLINKDTGNFILDENGNKITTTTDNSGRYIFSKIQEGTYSVLFEFDTNTYNVTTYQKLQIDEKINSDAILSNVNINGNEKQVAITDNIIINENKENIDLGLVKKPIFDLSLDKQINKISVISKKGTETYTYEDDEIAKVDLVAKYMANSNVIVTYTFTIKNEGEVTGYVNSLVDDIPSGLEFSSELNKDWYQGSDGKIYTNSLSQKAIKPGESIRVELVLTKIMTEENTGTFPNSARLEKISNLENIEEKEEAKENNESSAILIISIKTGSALMYIGITLICLAIISIGTYFINKKVLRRVI